MVFVQNSHSISLISSLFDQAKFFKLYNAYPRINKVYGVGCREDKSVRTLLTLQTKEPSGLHQCRSVAAASLDKWLTKRSYKRASRAPPFPRRPFGSSPIDQERPQAPETFCLSSNNWYALRHFQKLSQVQKFYRFKGYFPWFHKRSYHRETSWVMGSSRSSSDLNSNFRAIRRRA